MAILVAIMGGEGLEFEGFGPKVAVVELYGEIYVAGTSSDDRYDADIVVICLEPPPGVEERPDARQAPWSSGPTVVRGVLNLPATAPSGLLVNALGRRVIELEPGRNDLRHLSPGVYFCHSGTASSTPRREEASGVRKIILAR